MRVFAWHMLLWLGHACMSAHVCVCLHGHVCVCVHFRVCEPDDAGHHDPSGEEETGLRPRAHPDGGDLRGGPRAGTRGTDLLAQRFRDI